MKKEVVLSADIQQILKALPRRIRSFEHDATPTLVNLYAEVEPGKSASWAAIRRVMFQSRTGTQIQLRRFDPDTTSTRVRRNQIRVAANRTWVTVKDPDTAVEILVAHFQDLRAKAQRGEKVFDNRTYLKGRKNRAAAVPK